MVHALYGYFMLTTKVRNSNLSKAEILHFVIFEFRHSFIAIDNVNRRGGGKSLMHEPVWHQQDAKMLIIVPRVVIFFILGSVRYLSRRGHKIHVPPPRQLVYG